MPCMLRNFTIAGGFIEFPVEPPPDTRFRLRMDRFGFITGCEVRRRFGTAVGVTFFDAVPSQLVAVNAAARRGAQQGAAETAPATSTQAPLEDLCAMLERLVEFKGCGFAARSDRNGRGLQILRGSSIRGSWLAASAGLQWRPANGTVALEVETAAEAARATMLMVLNSVILRRASNTNRPSANGSHAYHRATLTRP